MYSEVTWDACHIMIAFLEDFYRITGNLNLFNAFLERLGTRTIQWYIILISTTIYGIHPMLFTGLCVQVDDTLRGSLPEEEKKTRKWVTENCVCTYVRLCGFRNRRPSGSCSGGRRLLCRRTADRYRTVQGSTFRWCTGRIGRSSQGAGTSVRRAFPGIATLVPRCILDNGSLKNVIRNNSYNS